MNDLSSSYTSISSQSRHSCKFEKIAKDQQIRLQMVISQLESQKQINLQLKQQIEILKANNNNGLDNYINEIQNLKDKCQILETKNDCLKKELAEARINRKCSEDGLSTVESDNRRLIQIVEKKKNKISLLKNRINETQNYEQYVERSNQLEEKVNQANKKILKLEFELSQANDFVKETKEKLQEMQGQLSVYSAEVSITEISDIKNKIRDQECIIKEKQANIDELSKQIAEKNQMLDKMDRNLKKVQLKQAKYKAYKKLSKDLSVQNEKLKAEIHSFSSLNSQINAAEAQIKSQHELIEKMRDENRNLKTNIENGSFSKLQGDYIDVRLERDSLMRDLSRLESKVQKINILEKENDELKYKNEELYNKIKEYANREQKQSENIRVLLQERKELEDIRNITTAVLEDLNKYKEFQQTLEEENKILKEQVTNFSKDLDKSINKETNRPIYNVSKTKIEKVTRTHSHTKHHKK